MGLVQRPRSPWNETSVQDRIFSGRTGHPSEREPFFLTGLHHGSPALLTALHHGSPALLIALHHRSPAPSLHLGTLPLTALHHGLLPFRAGPQRPPRTGWTYKNGNKTRALPPQDDPHLQLWALVQCLAGGRAAMDRPSPEARPHRGHSQLPPTTHPRPGRRLDPDLSSCCPKTSRPFTSQAPSSEAGWGPWNLQSPWGGLASEGGEAWRQEQDQGHLLRVVTHHHQAPPGTVPRPPASAPPR